MSKSLYTRGLQCTKSLWLKKYNKDVLTPPDEQMQSIFRTGEKVGAEACKLFPGGEKVPYEGTTYEEKIALTKKYIEQGVKNIYEATFEFDGILVMVDIFHINDDGSVELYEVKSSTWGPKKKLKEIENYIEDAAIQHYVVNGCGFEIKKTSLILLNSEYIRGPKLDKDQLFSKIDVTEHVLALQDEIPSHLDTFAEVLSDEINEPDIDIGWHCKHPYDCDAMEHCWKTQRSIPDYSVFDIFHLTKKSKALELYHQDIVNVADIPDDLEVTEKQQETILAWKDQTSIINKEEIDAFLSTLTYPIYHLDFETYQEAIPEFEGAKPYQQIPFQYSLHIEPEVGDIEHKEFLAKEGTDPREAVAKRLVEDIPTDVTVTAYHSNFEVDRLKELAVAFPQYEEHLLAIADNVVDLEVPFKNKSYYVPEMKGKSSIKVVLPALVPDMVKAYDDLNLIHNGGDAMNTFPKLVDMNDEKKAEYRTALLEYCKLDTWAMVEVLKKLKDV